MPTLFGLPREDVAKPLGLLLAAQFVLFVGVGAVIPTLPLYGKAIGLSSAVNGICISTPAIALLLGARLAGEFADRARKPAMLWGMALIAASDVGTAFATSVGLHMRVRKITNMHLSSVAEMCVGILILRHL